jgi:hypothetical protein
MRWCASGVQKGGVVFMSNGVVAVKGCTIAVAQTVQFPSRTVTSSVLRGACCTVRVVSCIFEAVRCPTFSRPLGHPSCCTACLV